MLNETTRFSRSDLKRAPPEAVLRLAKYLRLRTEGMSIRQVIALIRWRLHPNRRWGR